ncbi:MAG: MASE3 domain-containing protein [Desulfovermiculus sp.]|nr:MASE3 domain-containing protein [Desulfovermiculus sp.]
MSYNQKKKDKKMKSSINSFELNIRESSTLYRSIPWFLGLALLLALFVTSNLNYLLFHTLAEFISIAVAFALFIVIWNTRHFISNNGLVFLGIAYLFIGGIDLIHTLAYKGMGVISPSWGANPATQLWIAARFIESITLVLFPILYLKKIRPYVSLTIYTAITALILLAIFYWRIFPDCFIEGAGLTAFKKSSEYVICAILVIALILLFQRKEYFSSNVFILMVSSVSLTIFAELAFTFYVSVYGLSNLLGHFFKIISFFLIYAALVRSGLKDPYSLLFRELKEEQKRLERSETLHQEAQKIAHIGHWELSSPEATPLWSEEIFHIFGLDPGQSAPSFFAHADIIHPEDWGRLSQAIQELYINGTAFDLEFRIYRPDGHARWVHAQGTGDKNEDGSVSRMFGTAQDITDRKQAEEALQQREKHISSIFRSAPVGIGLVRDRELKMVNDRLCEMTGYTTDDLIDLSARILYPSDADFKFVGREKYALIAEHGTGMVETCWQRKDGTVFDVILSSTPVDLHDPSKGVTFTALDITERKHMEQALRESEEKYRFLVENAVEAICVAQDDRLVFSNSKIFDLLGYSPEEATSRPFEEFIHPDDRAMVMERHHWRLQGEEVPEGYDFRVARKSGEVRWVNLNVVMIEWEGRLASLNFLYDITARKVAEEEQERLQIQLTQAQKMEAVGRLAGGVAHDFNNMLSVILGNTEIAMAELDSAQPIHDNLLEIQKAAQRSSNVVRQLLAFARKQTVAPEVLDLNETVEEMLKMLRRLIGEDIDLSWQPGPNLWPIKIDPAQIDQILANLTVNARDAIAGTGKVTIETDNAVFDQAYCAEHYGFIPGDFVLLAVSDNGCGMDKETQKNLFEPFFSTKAVDKGTGLGLATVYGIVKQNEGFINVYSEPGEGTTFKIYLPRYAGSDEQTPETDQTEQPFQGSETILLVEDESSILKMAKKMLQGLGYHVLAARKPDEAIRLAQEHVGEVHLIVTDVVMPEMNGRDLAQNILSFYPNIKRLFMSGYTANVIAHHGVLDEGVNFIQKPFSRDQLAVKVRDALDKDAESE